MEKEVMRRILELFNHKTEKLFNSKFTKQVHESNLKIEGTKSKPISITLTQPDEESRNSFILSYKFFIQKRESISVRSLAKLYEESNFPEKLKAEFKKEREELNNFLDTPSMMVVNNKKFTYREIQDIFINGEYAHFDEKKRPVYESLMSNPLLKNMFEYELIHSLNIVLRFINNFYCINKDVLESLK